MADVSHAIPSATIGIPLFSLEWETEGVTTYFIVLLRCIDGVPLYNRS